MTARELMIHLDEADYAQLAEEAARSGAETATYAKALIRSGLDKPDSPPTSDVEATRRSRMMALEGFRELRRSLSARQEEIDVAQLIREVRSEIASRYPVHDSDR